MGSTTLVILSIGIFLSLFGGINLLLYSKGRPFWVKISNYIDSISLSTLITTTIFYALVNINNISLSEGLEEFVWKLFLMSLIMLLPKILNLLNQSLWDSFF